MRKAFCDSLTARADRADFAFLTGDLGFQAFEPLRDALGQRFINAGVAEQNMVLAAAGMAREGWRPWVYSIAPFATARPYEQIRNSICLHHLPVVVVGNGGGYGYGVMGATHHALEDCAGMSALASMRVDVPAFDEDVPVIAAELFDRSGPSYLRLGYSQKPRDAAPPRYKAWRKLLDGDAGTLVALGPLAGLYWSRCLETPRADRPNLWVACQLPIAELPAEFGDDVRAGGVVCVAEEHVAVGGLGSQLALEMLRTGGRPESWVHRPALGYPSGRYGSQAFHRRECGLDPAAILGLFATARETTR
jgi:transketolase